MLFKFDNELLLDDKQFFYFIQDYAENNFKS